MFVRYFSAIMFLCDLRIHFVIIITYQSIWPYDKSIIVYGLTCYDNNMRLSYVNVC